MARTSVGRSMLKSARRLLCCMLGACVFFVSALGSAVARAQTQPVLRVCADPNALPFSNQEEQGFENELARQVAKALDMKLEYFWWAQRRGFIRNTLGANRCDVVMGVPAGFERVLTTRPYYRSAYTFVQRTGTPPVRSFDDPALRSLRVGVQLIGDDFANSPPVHSLSQRGIVDNLVGFMVYGDYASPDPERPIMDAVASGAVDVAIVWGPLAGYYAARAPTPLQVAVVAPLVDGPLKMAFSMSVGVRKGQAALRDRIDGVLERRQAQIAALLARYAIPLVGGRE